MDKKTTWTNALAQPYCTATLVDDLYLSNRWHSTPPDNVLSQSVSNLSKILTSIGNGKQDTDSDKWLTDFSKSIEQDESILKLKNDINVFSKKLLSLSKEIEAHQLDTETKDTLIREKDNTIKELKVKIEHLINSEKHYNIYAQICDEAKRKSEQNIAFADMLCIPKKCQAYIISIDIRRSTELMLKSKSPQHFEQFINTFFFGLKNIVINNFGIFDKFTGDGALAFFPTHYSGTNAGLFALKAALECHQFFNDHYNTNRTCFDTILMNTGLGIGIDYGESYMANMNGLTLIGKNVVYACRLSATAANTTVLNQAAFEDISTKHPRLFSFSEVNIDVKEEGSILGYKIQTPQEKLEPAIPDWDKLLEEFKNSFTPTPA